ncbi:MAG: hypothetical protein HFE35_07950 [Clostridia bacterium]|jgi:hypothetical protein|nr:hypothetical protein [Clostridia bacterium]
MSRWRKLITILVCYLSIITFSGCSYKGYTGEYPELFTVAINSIPNVKGYGVSEVPHQPVVNLIEQDKYGRKFFCYSEEVGRYANDEERNMALRGGVNLVICQFSDSEYAYYYPNTTYISAPLCEGNRIYIYGKNSPATIDNPLNDFTDEEIEELKQKNDWGQELDLEKCEKAPIVRIKE